MESTDYEWAVNAFYEPAFRFARSLVRSPDDASELVQEAFSRLLEHSGSIRDRGKVKSWLFTTLYRVFLGWKRREARWPQVEISEAEPELPNIHPEQLARSEAGDVLSALQRIEERYRVPLALFYFETLTYDEIAATLEVPIGTVMSRIARGKDALRRLLLAPASTGRSGIVPFPGTEPSTATQNE